MHNPSDPRALVLPWKTILSFLVLHYTAVVCLLCLPGSVRVPAGSRWHSQNRIIRAEFNKRLIWEVWARGRETARDGGALQAPLKVWRGEGGGVSGKQSRRGCAQRALIKTATGRAGAWGGGEHHFLHPTGLHPIGRTQLEAGGSRSLEMCSEQIRPPGSSAGQEGHWVGLVGHLHLQINCRLLEGSALPCPAPT